MFRPGQILRGRQRHKARLHKHLLHVAARAQRQVLQRLDAQERAGGLHVGRHAGGTVFLAGHRDLRRIIARLLQLRPVGAALVLIVADPVIQGSRAAQPGDQQRHRRVGVPQHHRPRPAVPLPQLELVTALIARLPAMVDVVLILAAVGDVVRAGRVDVFVVGLHSLTSRKSVVILLAVPGPLRLRLLALVLWPLEAGQHRVAGRPDALRASQCIQHTTVVRTQLQSQEAQLHVQVANADTAMIGIGQQRLLPAPVGPLGQAIPCAVADEFGIGPAVHRLGVLVVRHPQKEAKAVLQVHRVQSALRVQIAHQPRRAEGVATSQLQQRLPDLNLVHTPPPCPPVPLSPCSLFPVPCSLLNYESSPSRSDRR